MRRAISAMENFFDGLLARRLGSAPATDQIKRAGVKYLPLCSAATFRLTNPVAAVEASIVITSQEPRNLLQMKFPQAFCST